MIEVQLAQLSQEALCLPSQTISTLMTGCPGKQTGALSVYRWARCLVSGLLEWWSLRGKPGPPRIQTRQPLVSSTGRKTRRVEGRLVQRAPRDI